MSNKDKKLGDFKVLREVIARLRSPEGCPWDREQTHASLKPFLIEECYEVLQALDGDSQRELCGELGDLLLQIMLHAQISEDEGTFTIEDVIRSLVTKLIQRHPHVFGDTEVRDAAEVKLNWEIIKRREREEDESILDTVPKQMPALTYSHSIQRRVAAVGFDWDKTEDILDKLTEEVEEILAAHSLDEKEKEFGDLLFTLVNIARRLDIDLEMALRSTNQRFLERFSYMEDVCRRKGVEISDLSFEEQNALWEEAKRI